MSKIVLFGAGNNCYPTIEFCGKENIRYIVDSSPAKDGGIIKGIKVISLSDYIKWRDDELVVISAYLRRNEIAEILLKIGINNYVSFPMNQKLLYCANEIVDLVCSKEYVSIDFWGQKELSTIIMWLLKGKMDCAYWENLENFITHIEKSDSIVVLMDNVLPKNMVRLPTSRVVNLFEYNKKRVDHFFSDLNNQKDKYIGKSCFLIGNGPSLSCVDLDCLKKMGIMTFACNKIHLMYPLADWRPDFIAVAEGRDVSEVCEKNKDTGTTIFINYIGEMLKCNNLVMYWTRVVDDIKEFEILRDIVNYGVVGGRTIMISMIQIAVYLGFKELYLLGVDFSWGEDGRETHFTKEYMDDRIVREQMRYKEEQLNFYMLLKEKMERHGIKIYNATRGGHLEVFERVDFDKLMENWSNE